MTTNQNLIPCHFLTDKDGVVHVIGYSKMGKVDICIDNQTLGEFLENLPSITFSPDDSPDKPL